MDITEITACFTGHRIIEKRELPALKRRLSKTVKTLINQGVVCYGCGGALGFDTVAAAHHIKTAQKISSYPAYFSSALQRSDKTLE